MTAWQHMVTEVAVTSVNQLIPPLILVSTYELEGVLRVQSDHKFEVR